MHSTPSEASILRDLFEKEARDHTETKAQLAEAKWLLQQALDHDRNGLHPARVSAYTAFLVKNKKNE